jgi:hypothetical protein
MSRFRQADILVELLDLSRDRIDEVRQQLSYYRASVYKDETGGHITTKIEELRLIAVLLGDVLVQESFRDYDAMSKAGVLNYIPGECSLSKRVGSLMTALDQHLDRLQRLCITRQTGSLTNEQEFTAAILRHRNQLLALCPHGSRQWSFFQSL